MIGLLTLAVLLVVGGAYLTSSTTVRSGTTQPMRTMRQPCAAKIGTGAVVWAGLRFASTNLHYHNAGL